MDGIFGFNMYFYWCQDLCWLRSFSMLSDIYWGFGSHLLIMDYGWYNAHIPPEPFYHPPLVCFTLLDCAYSFLQEPPRLLKLLHLDS